MNVYVRELARELGKRGHRVDIFTRLDDPQAVRVTTDGMGPDTRVVRLPVGPLPYDKHRAFDDVPEFVRGVEEFAGREGIAYDVYHAHYWLSGWTAVVLQQYQPAPIVQMFHTLGAMKTRAARSAADSETETRVEIEGEIMRRVDRIVAATPRDCQDMVELYGAPSSKISVIPPGVDVNLFRPIDRTAARQFLDVPAGNHRMLLFVGRIDPVKGIEFLLKGLALIVRRDPELRRDMCMCLIGGDVDEEPAPDTELARLQALKHDLGLGDMVTFLGRRDQESLPYYYSAADVVVMPSLYESFGMAALEAMACGTPVVASDVGGLSYLVRDGETGFLVPRGSPRALSNTLGCLLRTPELRARFSVRCVEVAHEYRWPRIADQIEALYGTLTR